jgi:glycine/D-amino acid oxidase-like deaminating enzyme
LSIEGLWVNTGYSGHGIMLGPAGSRLLVDLLTGNVESNPFGPGRAFERREPPTL